MPNSNFTTRSKKFIKGEQTSLNAEVQQKLKSNVRKCLTLHWGIAYYYRNELFSTAYGKLEIFRCLRGFRNRTLAWNGLSKFSKLLYRSSRYGLNWNTLVQKLWFHMRFSSAGLPWKLLFQLHDQFQKNNTLARPSDTWIFGESNFVLVMALASHLSLIFR